MTLDVSTGEVVATLYVRISSNGFFVRFLADSDEIKDEKIMIEVPKEFDLVFPTFVALDGYFSLTRSVEMLIAMFGVWLQRRGISSRKLV